MAHFVLGDVEAQKLTEEQLDSIRSAIAFKTMQQQAVASGNTVVINKGIIGNWKRKLSAKQSARIDRIVNARFRGTGLTFDFGE